MPNLLNNAAEWLAGQIEQHASDSVKYIRGDAFIPWPAARGTTDFDALDEYGGVIQIRAIDFIGPAAKLDFGDGPTEPLIGDTIEVCEPAGTTTYEVTPFGSGRQHFRPAGQFGKQWRIHTQRITIA